MNTNKLIIFLLLVSILIFSCSPVRHRSRVIRRNSQASENHGVNGLTIGKQHLFLVAIDRYRDWPQLPGPVSEALKLKKVLVRRYHIDNVKELYNEKATKGAIRDYLIGLQEGRENQLAEEDSLFIYFSGHGQSFEEETRNGYWIPYNGGPDMEARAYWFSNSELTGLLKKIKARHILVVSDSCFAATLMDTGRGGVDWNREKNYLNRVYYRCSRKVLTSGGLERVPGDSVFARLLREELSKNRKPWIKMEEIYQSIRRGVFEKTGNHPEYGNLKNTGFDPSASFVLFTREGWEKLVNQQKEDSIFRLNLNVQLRFSRAFFLNLNFHIGDGT